MTNNDDTKNCLDKATEVMTEITEQEPDYEKQKEAYENYLQLDDNQAEELLDVEQSAYSVEEFDDFDDDELEQIYEHILDCKEEDRNDAQRAMLETTKERYLKIKFYREFEDAARWFSDEYPQKAFCDIVNSDDFLEFASGVKLPIRELVRRYVNMNEKIEAAKTRVSSGSVSTDGTTVGKDYFTSAEVDKMSEDEIVKNLEIIKKSMRKWK